MVPRAVNPIPLTATILAGVCAVFPRQNLGTHEGSLNILHTVGRHGDHTIRLDQEVAAGGLQQALELDIGHGSLRKLEPDSAGQTGSQDGAGT